VWISNKALKYLTISWQATNKNLEKEYTRIATELASQPDRLQKTNNKNSNNE
jgi:hypothetical protein